MRPAELFSLQGYSCLRFKPMNSLLNGTCTLVMTSSLHQFVTTSPNNNSLGTSLTTTRPALGLSETWYSWIVSAISMGVVSGALLFGLVAKRVYFKVILVVEVAIVGAGGILYAIGTAGWMLLIARYCVGLFIGLNQSLLRTYIAETSAKQETKKKVFFVILTITATGISMGAGLTYIASLMPSLDQFRWPGYYIIIHSSVLLIVIFTLFDEKWNDIYRVSSNTSNNYSILKHFKDLKIITFVMTFVVAGFNLAIVETLLNPILSDIFGLDVTLISYIIFGIAGLYFFVQMLLYLLQRLNINDVNITIGILLITISGLFMLSDWQSLKGDMCQEMFISSHNTTPTYNADRAQCIIDTTIDPKCLCELPNTFNETEQQCFWNPASRITRKHCKLCRPVCLDKECSLTLPQFILGSVLIAINYPIMRYSGTTLASYHFGKSSQGGRMSLLIITGGLGRGVAPLWANAAYIGVDHHTWLPMTVLIIVHLVTLLLYVVQYNQLKVNADDLEASHDDELEDTPLSIVSEISDNCDLGFVHTMATQEKPIVVS